MKKDIQKNANQTANSNAVAVRPIETKPKIQFGTIEIAAVVIIILAAIVAYIGKMIWDRRGRFIKASDEFRAAFDVAMHALETIPFCDRDILNENYGVHEKAMIKFRDNLKGRRLNSFNKDWKQYEQYCLSRVDVPLLCFLATEVSDINGPNDSAEIDLKHRRKALGYIRQLLSYTKK